VTQLPPSGAEIIHLTLRQGLDSLDHPTPAAPHFFGSGVLSDDGERRVVE